MTVYSAQQVFHKKWVDFSLLNTFSSLVRLGRHFGVVYLMPMVKIREISVYFDHFWSLCNGKHCSVGLLWGIWIEPSLPNAIGWRTTLESYTLRKWWKFEQIRFILIIFLCNGQYCSVGLLWEIWIESCPSPQHPYAIGSTWKPLWSDIPWEDGKSPSDLGPSWSFSKLMLWTTLLSWASVGGL